MAKTKPETATEEHIEALLRGASSCIPDKESVVKALQAAEEPLRIKLGIDPTTPDLHFGYFVTLRRLKVLRQLGHQIQILFGGFTARFGDPTDKDESRTLRGHKEVREAQKHYKKELEKFFGDKEHGQLSIAFEDNSSWYDNMSAEDLLRLMSETTAAQMLERDMFRQRQGAGKAIGLHELVYPLLQGNDSVELESDITIVGQDQLFNENVARPLQERVGQRPQMIVALELIPGTDGNMKMSQSLGNAILLNDTSQEQFGKLMSLSDEAAMQYAKMLTNLDMDELQQKMNEGGGAARDTKLLIAEDIIEQLHGPMAAETTRKQFLQQFQEGTAPQEAREVKIEEGTTLADVLVLSGARESNSAARRVIEQKGVRVQGEVVTDPKFKTKPGMHIQIGKREHIQLA